MRKRQCARLKERDLASQEESAHFAQTKTVKHTKSDVIGQRLTWFITLIKAPIQKNTDNEDIINEVSFVMLGCNYKVCARQLYLRTARLIFDEMRVDPYNGTTRRPVIRAQVKTMR